MADFADRGADLRLPTPGLGWEEARVNFGCETGTKSRASPGAKGKRDMSPRPHPSAEESKSAERQNLVGKCSRDLSFGRLVTYSSFDREIQWSD
jgi:hypothetical protein